VEAFLGLAALIALAWGWIWIKGKVREKANQNIFSRTAHRQGQELTESILRADVSGDLKAIQAAIVAHVVIVAAPPLVISDIYLDSVVPGRIEYVCGTKLATAFRAVVTIRETDGRVIVEQMFSHWMTLDGVVAPVSSMQRLRTDLERGVHSVDPGAVVNVRRSSASR
jgi:hypothetical protein